MIPKSQMITVHEEDDLETIISIVKESGHSRFPVLNRTNTEIVGIILAKDLLTYCANRTDTTFTFQTILRPAFFIPQSKRLDVLLREFRINRNHIAIVLDEYSHIAGLVTIEDVLEQIVGNIEDEYDIDESEGHIKKIAARTYILNAATPLAEFNEYFHAHLQDETFDTIGGLILKTLKHLPKRGENVAIDNYQFKVLQSDHRRIHLLEMKTDSN